MRKILNPFSKLEGYNCFGCSTENPVGLQMKFFEEGEEIKSEWSPGVNHQGYHHVLHGGIQATLMDEIASWVVYVKAKRAGVTSKMDLRFLKPVYINHGPVKLSARILGFRKNLADIDVKLIDHNNILCAQALVTYFTFSPEKSKESFYYPEPEAFFEKE